MDVLRRGCINAALSVSDGVHGSAHLVPDARPWVDLRERL